MAKSTLTAKDFQTQILAEVDKYVHDPISRREFINRSSEFEAGVSGAMNMLASLNPNYPADLSVARSPALFNQYIR